MHQPADERFANSHDELYGFNRLHYTNDARQDSSAHHLPRNSAPSRAVAAPDRDTGDGSAKIGRENRALALEPENRAVDVGFVQKHADVVRQIPGRKVVCAIDDDVIRLDDLHGILASEHGIVQDHVDVGVGVLDAVASAVELLAADIFCAVQHLTLQIREIDDIEINESQCADPAAARSKAMGGAQVRPFRYKAPWPPSASSVRRALPPA